MSRLGYQIICKPSLIFITPYSLHGRLILRRFFENWKLALFAVITTSGATSDEKVGITGTLGFQCSCFTLTQMTEPKHTRLGDTYMRQWYGTSLVQVWPGDSSLPKLYLKQCWLIVDLNPTAKILLKFDLKNRKISYKKWLGKCCLQDISHAIISGAFCQVRLYDYGLGDQQ